MATLIAMTQPTPLYRLVEARLGGEGALTEYVTTHKATTSWRTMAADLTERTGETVTYETLRGWFADRVKVTVTVEPPSAGAA
jgi:hypothetical protein